MAYLVFVTAYLTWVAMWDRYFRQRASIDITRSCIHWYVRKSYLTWVKQRKSRSGVGEKIFYPRIKSQISLSSVQEICFILHLSSLNPFQRPCYCLFFNDHCFIVEAHLFSVINRESYMSVHVLSNLLSKLGKCDKIRGL